MPGLWMMSTDILGDEGRFIKKILNPAHLTVCQTAPFLLDFWGVLEPPGFWGGPYFRGRVNGCPCDLP